MPRDINGVYTLPAGNPVVPGTVISTTWANNTLADLASAMTASLYNGDLQSSPLDETPGKLLAVGSFGLGTAGIATTNLDTITVTGIYKSSGSATGVPVVNVLGYDVNYVGDANFGIMEITSFDSRLKYMRIRTSGSWSLFANIFTSDAQCLVVKDTGSLGFGAGAGGTVTQLTSKSTSVTLNKPSGRITMHNAALAAGASVGFTMNNSTIGAADTVNYCTVGGTGSANYRVETYSLEAGAVAFRITNITAGSLSEALKINFSVIKGAIT